RHGELDALRKGGQPDRLDDPALGDVHDDEAVQVRECAVERLLVAADRHRAWHAADGNLGEVTQRLQVDQVHRVPTHRRDEQVVVAVGVVAVVWHLDGQTLEDLALANVHKVHPIAVPDRHTGEGPVGGDRALVGEPAEPDRPYHLVVRGV